MLISPPLFMCYLQELADFEKMPDEPKIDADGQYNMKILKINIDCKIDRNEIHAF